MLPLQLFFIIFTFVAPPLFWWLGRRFSAPWYDRAVARGLAGVLLLAYAGDLTIKIYDGDLFTGRALPMQLCDWTLFAVAAALWFGWRTGFELGYFWGLGGTLQALFTPAIDANVGILRLFGFFLSHSIIVVGVVYLMLARGFRPQPASLIRVAIASEIYFVTALITNGLTGQNYGFLAHKPPTRSMLDLFSDTWWLYVVQLNLTGLVMFAFFYLPWLLVDRLRRRATSERTAPSPRA